MAKLASAFKQGHDKTYGALTGVSSKVETVRQGITLANQVKNDATSLANVIRENRTMANAIARRRDNRWHEPVIRR